MQDFSLQLYSLRDVSTLRERMEIASKAGYTGVEFAGYEDYTAVEMKQLLASLGLRGTGSHISYDLLKQDLAGCVAYCEQAGITSAACPGIGMSERDDALRAAEFLETCAEAFEAAGICFAYHNHAHEFEQDGGQYLLEIMLDNTILTGFELDVYWTAYAGVDPLSFIQKHAGKFSLLHFKDIDKNCANVELGRGTLDFAALGKAGIAQGARELIVEQEEYTLPPAESVTVDAVYMKALTF